MKENEFMIAQIRGWGHLQYLGEAEGIAIQEANGRLIASAPDLLAACKVGLRFTSNVALADIRPISKGDLEDAKKAHILIENLITETEKKA